MTTRITLSTTQYDILEHAIDQANGQIVWFPNNVKGGARQAAAQGLVLLGSPRGFAYAKAKLASSDRYERMAALALFDGVGAKAAAPLVAPLLDDEDRRLAAQAARVLYDGGDRSKLEWLVLQSYQANGEERLPYEEVLERLRLTDEQRAAILRQKGIVR